MAKSTPNLASKPTTTAPVTTATPAPAQSPSLETTTTMAATTNEPTWLTGPALKAANEYTFATQRAKKAADRAKSKAAPRKAPGSTSTPKRSSSSSASSAATAAFAMSYPANGSTAAKASIWAEVWDAARKVDDDTDWPELPTPLGSLSQRYWSPSASPAEFALRPTQDREVPLAALVRSVKAHGAKTKESEFEFLPQVKNVIALDDAESNIPDEPWEYISSVGERDDEARKIFSYAEIVSKSA